MNTRLSSEEYGEAYTTGFARTVRHLRCRGVQAEHAEEVAQEAWVRGYERLYQLKEASFLLAWVNTIALNTYRRMIIKQSQLDSLEGVSISVSPSSAPADIARILILCRPADRALLELQMQGVTPAELAATRRISATAARIRFFKARRCAKALLDADVPTV